MQKCEAESLRLSLEPARTCVVSSINSLLMVHFYTVGTSTHANHFTCALLVGCSRRHFGWVNGFLYSVSYIKPFPTHEKLFAVGKSGPNPTFNLFFLGLGWPWVGEFVGFIVIFNRYMLSCLLYTSPSPRDQRGSRMPSSA